MEIKTKELSSTQISKVHVHIQAIQRNSELSGNIISLKNFSQKYIRTL